MDTKTHEPLAIEARAGDGQYDAICRGLARLDLDQPTVNFVENFEERLFSEAKGTVTFFVSPNQYDDFVDLLERYTDAGNDFYWFYPVPRGGQPKLPEKLQKHVNIIPVEG